MNAFSKFLIFFSLLPLAWGWAGSVSAAERPKAPKLGIRSVRVGAAAPAVKPKKGAWGEEDSLSALLSEHSGQTKVVTYGKPSEPARVSPKPERLFQQRDAVVGDEGKKEEDRDYEEPRASRVHKPSAYSASERKLAASGAATLTSDAESLLAKNVSTLKHQARRLAALNAQSGDAETKRQRRVECRKDYDKALQNLRWAVHNISLDVEHGKKPESLRFEASEYLRKKKDAIDSSELDFLSSILQGTLMPESDEHGLHWVLKVKG